MEVEMTTLGDMFYEMYRVDLDTLDQVIEEARRIRTDRHRYPQFEVEKPASGADE
jgi:hypothetical protein